MKSLSSKLIAATLILGLAAGCASVTDAGLNEPAEQPTLEQVPTPEPAPFGDADVKPIIDKPDA